MVGEKKDQYDCSTLKTTTGKQLKNTVNLAVQNSIYEKRIGNKNPIGEDVYLSPKSAALYLDVSVKLIYKLIETRQIPSQPVGRRLKRIRKSVLDSWLSAQLKGAQSL